MTSPAETVGVRVLLADDHPLVRQGLELALSAAPGLTVCGTAPDGVEAVRQALEQHPDIVVLDVSMPGGDGLTAARELRRLLPAVRIVVLTWRASSRPAALEAGADLFLLKDTSPGVLVERLRTLVPRP
ncbi:response regulator [Lapillicoccus jejuensis]|uniref:response regulator n=1 Tax=Lapillicoccus jejuensis TaxID=402171 RepID=UPI001150B8A6|nr:response regulator transcription factor [Lapillicoccus jejuensis]